MTYCNIKHHQPAETRPAPKGKNGGALIRELFGKGSCLGLHSLTLHILFTCTEGTFPTTHACCISMCLNVVWYRTAGVSLAMFMSFIALNIIWGLRYKGRLKFALLIEEFSSFKKEGQLWFERTHDSQHSLVSHSSSCSQSNCLLFQCKKYF